MINKLRRGFTLIELLITTVLISFILLIVIYLYSNMLSVRVDVETKQSLIQNTYFMLEKLNSYMKDYTIDYEEYYARKVIGCAGDSGIYSSNFSTFSWKDWSSAATCLNCAVPIGDGYCGRFTDFGNGNIINGTPAVNNWRIYYCSSENAAPESTPNTVYRKSSSSTLGCRKSDDTSDEWQSYGVYARQFWDVHRNVDGKKGLVGDDDDEDLGVGPTAIANNTGVQELYLINKSGDKRFYIRRQKIGMYSGGTLPLFNLKAIKLKGFDAGTNHDFLSTGTYDGQIDTRACDYSEGFRCSGQALGSVYGDYHLASGSNDGRIELFGRDLNVEDWNLEIFPNTDPKLAWKMNGMQINPYVKIYIKTKLNPDVRSPKYSLDRINKFEMDLSTTFNIKTNY